MEHALAALLVFCLRICDVSIGTMRVLYMIRGQRLRAGMLALVESSIFIFAISQVLRGDAWQTKIGYACGFAAGTLVGMTIEGWIATGFVLVRVIGRDHSLDVRGRLRDAGFGVTSIQGQGREGDLLVLFVVAPRRRSHELLALIRERDPDAFVTVDEVNQAIGGHLPRVAAPAGVRK